DPLPEWKIGLRGAGDMFEQPHPKCGYRLMIEVADTVMRSESADLFAHSLQCLFRRQGIQVTQRDRDVGRVSEVGCWNGRVCERGNESSDFAVAGEIPCSQ